MRPNSEGDRTIPAEKRDTLREPWRVDEPSVSEHAMLDLSLMLSDAAGSRVVSVHHQRVAYRYVRRFGWAAAVERLTKAGRA